MKRKLSLLLLLGALSLQGAYAADPINQGVTLISNANNSGMFIVNPSNPSTVCWGTDNDFPQNALRAFTASQLNNDFKKCNDGYNEFGVVMQGAATGIKYPPIVIRPGQTCTVNYNFFKGGFYFTCS